jgi:hypothetical protein
VPFARQALLLEHRDVADAEDDLGAPAAEFQWQS